MARRTVCVVTGTRADYGLLRPVMEAIRADGRLALQIIATGQHLSPEFGLTVQVIRDDGLAIDDTVEMLLSSDTAVGVATSLGLGTIGFATSFARLRPDMVLLLGDRFEILAAAQAALIARIPVAHIAGGDLTLGAIDESMRHAITKMAHIHFATNESSAARVRQMGEIPSHVVNSGSPGIDALLTAPRKTQRELTSELGFEFREKNLLVTFHPATLDVETPAAQFTELANALDALGPAVGIALTMPNADTDGRSIREKIVEFVARRPAAKAFESLGTARYVSMMAAVDCVVGNSSSGLYEAPSLRVPTVDIGDRQRGRLKAESVIRCECRAASIEDAIRRAFVLDCSNVTNPYGDGHAAARIVETLAGIANPRDLLQKRFVTWGDQR